MKSTGVLFSIVEDAMVVLRKGGVYRQAKVYQRDGQLYAQHGGGYITIGQNGGMIGTSVPNINVDAYNFGFEPEISKLGRFYAPGTLKASERRK